MIIGGYSLDLYCDTDNPKHNEQRNFGNDKISVGGNTQADAVRVARRAGWIINWKTGEARCPICRKYKPTTSST